MSETGESSLEDAPERDWSGTPAHKRILEAQEVEHIAHADSRGGVAVAGVRLATDEAVLEAEEVEDVKRAGAGGLVAVGGARIVEVEQYPDVVAGPVQTSS